MFPNPMWPYLRRFDDDQQILGLDEAVQIALSGDITYLLRDLFSTDHAAGVVNGTLAEPAGGVRTVTDGSNLLALSSGKATQSGAGASKNPKLYWNQSDNTRHPGRVFTIFVKAGASNNAYNIGWSKDGSAITDALQLGNGSTFAYENDGYQGGALPGASAVLANLTYELAFVQKAIGADYYIKGGQYQDWYKVFSGVLGSEASLYAIVSCFATATGFTYFDARIFDAPQLLSVFAVDQNPPTNDTSYTAAADEILTLTVTAPTPLAGNAWLYHHYVDANNYHVAGFDSSGAFRAYKIIAGVLTEYSSAVNVAGAITQGQTRTIQVISSNSSQFVFRTGAAGVWTQRGGTINDNFQLTAAIVHPVVDAGWVLGLLHGEPLSNSVYTSSLGKAAKWLIVDGDSLTAGQNSTSGLNYPAQAIELAGTVSTWDYYNSGVSGQTTSQMTADAATEIDARYDGTRAKNIAVIWGGTNDLAGSVATGTIEANLQTWCTARRAAGFKVVICTIIARGTLTAPQETQRGVLNTWIVANWASFADALADLAANAHLQNASDTTYYSVDTIHLNNTGYGVVGGIVGPIIAAL